MKTVETKNAPEAIGPYSQAKITGGLVFASGQIPVNPASGNIEADDVAGQTEQVCKNVAALLEAAGSSIDKVVKTVCFWLTSPTLRHSTPYMKSTSPPVPLGAVWP